MEIQLKKNIMKKIHANKLEKREEKDKFLETYKMPKLKPEEYKEYKEEYKT